MWYIEARHCTLDGAIPVLVQLMKVVVGSQLCVVIQSPDGIVYKLAR